jgi:hypothetical protein
MPAVNYYLIALPIGNFLFWSRAPILSEGAPKSAKPDPSVIRGSMIQLSVVVDLAVIIRATGAGDQRATT